MDVNLRKAVNVLYGTASFMSIYEESVMNSIDAEATEINITTSIDGKNEYSILIEDNGVGFTEERYKNFCKLFGENEIDKDHKGLGRLAYLNYFSNIDVSSIFEYEGVRFLRKFVFSFDFSQDSGAKTEEISNKKKTTLKMHDFCGGKIHELKYLKPNEIKKFLLKRFLPKFYLLKKNEVDFKINITNYDETDEITQNDIPSFQEKIVSMPKMDIDNKLNFMSNPKLLFYSDNKQSQEEAEILTALCIDNRAYTNDGKNVIDKLPNGYKFIVLLELNDLNKDLDPTRKMFFTDNTERKKIWDFLKEQVINLINNVFPEIRDINEKIYDKMLTKYPYLEGYFDKNTLGVIDEEKSFKEAQDKFNLDQKETLGADNFDDALYKKSLEVSSRVLAEYVLYRNRTIHKLEEINEKNEEKDIHNIIFPMRESVSDNEKNIDLIWRNNVWLLDDRYMNFMYLASDDTIKHFYELLGEEYQGNSPDQRPDISLVLSDSEASSKFDIVVVELKKKKASIEENQTAITQLWRRANALSQIYESRINRLWLYAIIDFGETDTFENYLKSNSFTQLFSTSIPIYYREASTVADNNISFMRQEYVMSYDTLVADAKKRNETFLSILRTTIKNSINSPVKSQ